jgi:multisubunit Na+/H+ antiporter MnhG subunit
LTGPTVFDTVDTPRSSQDLTPVTRARGRSPVLIVAALFVCAIGIAWTLGEVAVGVKGVLTQPVSTQLIGA